ncbi:MAG TPA: hypothetical protein VFP72_13925 [Kineosporiaceae bacterium]|nr:hypothetical protein [Kineosporiaceae bacterium]
MRLGPGRTHRLRSVLGVLSLFVLGTAGTGAAAPAVSAMSGLRASAQVRPGPAITGPGSGYQLSTERMPDGRTVTLRWNPCQTITYKANVAALPGSLRPVVLGEIRAAVARLAKASGLRLDYRGPTSEVPRSTTLDQQSAEIVVAVTTPQRTDFPIGGQTLGYGGRSWYWWWHDAGFGTSYGAAITRGFVVLDATGVRELRAGFGPGVDRGNLLLHELGHAVGLDHAGSTTALMHSELTDTAPDGYSSGDRAGLARVGRNAGCIDIPVQLPAPDLK